MEQPSTARIALKWGIIGGLASIVLSTAIFMTELWKSPIASFLPILLMIVFLVLAIKEFKTDNGEFMSFGQGLGVGTLTGAVLGLLSSMFGQLYQKVIDPTFLTRMKDFQYEKMEEQGLSDAQIEQAMAMTEKFSNGGLSFAIGLIFTIFFAFLFSLAIAGIMKKNKPVF